MSERDHNRQARIVVGLDGSDESTEALRWALQECRLRGATLHAVMVWHDPSSYDLGHPYLSDLKQEEQAARARLDETIRAVTDEAEFAAWLALQGFDDSDASAVEVHVLPPKAQDFSATCAGRGGK